MNGGRLGVSWQFTLVQLVCYSFVSCSCLALILVGASRTKSCDRFRVFDFYSLANSTKSAKKKVDLLRKNDIQTTRIYFDSATSQLPTYSQLRCEVLAHQNKLELSASVRERLLGLLNTTSEVYEFLFMANPVDAVKFVGEGMAQKKVVVDYRTHFDTMLIRKFVKSENVVVYNASVNTVFDKDTLFVLSLEDAFNGDVFPFDIPNYRDLFGRTKFLVDATTFVPNSILNLTEFPFDAVVIDFRRLFGTVDLAALVIRKDFLETMHVMYHSCSDLVYALAVTDKEQGCPRSHENVKVKKSELVSIQCGLDLLDIIGYEELAERLSEFRKRLYKTLKWLTYGGGRPKFEVYGTENGAGIVAFNALTEKGDYVSDKVTVEKLAPRFIMSYGCHGVFGSCAKSLGMNESVIYEYLADKKEDIEDPDMIGGVPVGAARVSLGWLTTEADIDALIDLFKK